MINCPNLSCQTPNSEDTNTCSVCGTPIPHHYLWVVGAAQLGQPGDYLYSRYEIKGERIVLDTQPGLIPESPPEFPSFVLPYLALSGYALNVPRPYALLQDGEGGAVLLLEDAAIAAKTAADIPQLLPALNDCWEGASPLRQLNWLWQIAQLWQPFATERVVSSLLELPLQRVEGATVRLLELRSDSTDTVELSHLGQVWQPLAERAHAGLQDFLQTLCQRLEAGEFTQAEQLIACLDSAVLALGQGQTTEYEIAVQTDQGPVRQRNEDACYPASGTHQTYTIVPQSRALQPLLMIVCDGIGGHQGGDVASQLAIAAIGEHLNAKLTQPHLSAREISAAIETAICAANDQIAQQNDSEARQARDRMGTTLVMALILGPQIYIAHVGDSRAYAISQRSCRQITLDDDVAAREVRLGYGFYREVVDHPGAGALVQALGMNASQSLYPNLQRLIIDDESLLLLCSDGLSDNDRVEQFWRNELLPVLQQRQSAAAGTATLIQLANTYNGHDNVTVGLIRGRAVDAAKQPLPAELASPTPVATRPAATIIAPTAAPPAKARAKSSLLPLLIGIIGLIGIAGGLIAFFFSDLFRERQQLVPPVVNTVPELSTPTAAPPASLRPGTYARIQSLQSSSELPLPLYQTPQLVDSDNPALSGTIVGRLPAGSLVQVIRRQEATDEFRWIQLRVCTSTNQAGNDQADPLDPSEPARPPASAAAASQPTGNEGWVLESQLATLVEAVDRPTAAELSGCDR
ncbi:MAG: serine/threonine protein phosphatase [Leptolyngbya sp. SIO4C1]|nr:serine/threonine protein phosphatase [Leptolyngbya sp. SIO4C1]